MFGRTGFRPPFNQYQVPPEYSGMMNQRAPMPSMEMNAYNMGQQPYPFHPSAGNWNPHLQSYIGSNQQVQQESYPYVAQQMANQISPNPYPGYEMPQYGQQKASANYVQSIFQNPLEPEEAQYGTNAQAPYSANPYMNPYPKQSFIPKKPSGVQSLMNSFKSQDGSLDINKMMDTAGSMMNAVNQVSSMVKGLGGIIKI